MDISELDDLNIETTNTGSADEVAPIEEGQEPESQTPEDGGGEAPEVSDSTGQSAPEVTASEVEGQKPEPEVETSDLTGIEQYLSKFDIEGGMIGFDDGTSAHFTELEPEKQVEILSQLHDSTSTSVEDQYGLNEDEIGLVNYLRENNTTVDDMIDQMANQRAQTYIMSQQVNDMDISKMGDDAIYTAFLLKSNPEATAEQVEKDLETAKKMTNYNNIAANLRTNFEQERSQLLSSQKAERQEELKKEIEEQRTQVVDVVSNIQELDGLQVNDTIKNDVLDLILTVDEDGDSKFMTDTFSDPEKLFKAAFWYKNGADIVKVREDYWKKEKSAAYKRGLEDASKGKRTFSASDVKDRNETTPRYGDPDEPVSLDELYI